MIMRGKSFWALVVSVLICEAAGGIGSVFTTPSIGTWYGTLVKPAINPPNWVFAPVWTTLFLLMGIAAFLVWRSGAMRPAKRNALIVFGAQLVLNVFWSILFFGARNPFFAFIEIIVLWLVILWTILAFHKISEAAASLLLPYIVWVSFAAYLNYSLWILN